MKGFTQTAFLLIALLGTSGVSYAQTSDSTAAHHGKDMMQIGTTGSMMPMCPMMAGVDQGPEAALEHAEELGLTDEQRGQLEALQDVLTAEQRAKLRQLRHRRAMERMMGMMNMMMRMMDMMGEMGDSGMTMPDTSELR